MGEILLFVVDLWILFIVFGYIITSYINRRRK